MKRSTLKKKLALVLGIIVFAGLLPLQVMAAEGVSVFGERDSTGASAILSNPLQENVDALLVFGVYDSLGRLVHVETKEVKVLAGSSLIQRFGFNTLPNRNNTYTYKLFAWEPITYIPMCQYSLPAPSLCITVDDSGAKYDGVTVTAAPEVTEFMYVEVDGVRKIGVAYTAVKSDNGWNHTKVQGADVIIAYKPLNVIGGTLPTVRVTNLDTRVSNNPNKLRIVISQ